MTTNYQGKLIATGAGRLLSFLVSHGEAGAQAVTFYDNTAGSGTVLLVVDVPAGIRPTLIRFPRAEAPAFATGLYVIANSAHVAVWVVGN